MEGRRLAPFEVKTLLFPDGAASGYSRPTYRNFSPGSEQPAMSAEDPTPQVAQRRRHERTVFHEIRCNGPISRAQLADRTGLSAQAMGAIVKGLLEMGLIEERPMARREGPGAPATGIQLRPDGAFAFGFGLERDSLSGVLVDLSGSAALAVQAPGRARRAAHRHPRRAWLRPCVLFSGARGSAMSGAALGAWASPLPGRSTWQKARSWARPTSRDGRRWPSLAASKTATGLPVLVDNAASAAALGVEWQMLPSHGSFLYCYWGLGIGGGLVIGREAYRGSTGNVAELGHVVVNENGRPCACGGRGCLEAESSAAALLRDARQFGQFSSIEAVAAAAEHMPSVKQLLEKAAHQMAAALVSAINLTDVPEVVIGGAHFAAVGEIFLPILQSAIDTPGATASYSPGDPQDDRRGRGGERHRRRRPGAP